MAMPEVTIMNSSTGVSEKHHFKMITTSVVATISPGIAARDECIGWSLDSSRALVVAVV